MRYLDGKPKEHRLFGERSWVQKQLGELLRSHGFKCLEAEGALVGRKWITAWGPALYVKMQILQQEGIEKVRVHLRYESGGTIFAYYGMRFLYFGALLFLVGFLLKAFSGWEGIGVGVRGLYFWCGGIFIVYIIDTPLTFFGKRYLHELVDAVETGISRLSGKT